MSNFNNSNNNFNPNANENINNNVNDNVSRNYNPNNNNGFNPNNNGFNPNNNGFAYGNNQSNNNEYINSLTWIRKITKSFLWIFILYVILFTIAIILTIAATTSIPSYSYDPYYGRVTADSSSSIGLSIAALAMFILGGILAIVDFALNIIFIVKIGIIKKFTRDFDTIFIFALIGLLISIFGLIALIMASTTARRILEGSNSPSYSNNSVNF